MAFKAAEDLGVNPFKSLNTARNNNVSNSLSVSDSIQEARMTNFNT